MQTAVSCTSPRAPKSIPQARIHVGGHSCTPPRSRLGGACGSERVHASSAHAEAAQSSQARSGHTGYQSRACSHFKYTHLHPRYSSHCTCLAERHMSLELIYKILCALCLMRSIKLYSCLLAQTLHTK